MKDKIKKYLKENKLDKKTIAIIKYVASGLLFFSLIELFIKIPALKTADYYIAFNMCSILFTFFYSFVFLFYYYIVPKKMTKVTGIVLYTIFILLAIINYFLIQIKQVPLSISLLSLTEEGFNYLNMVLKKIKPFPIIMLILCIFSAIINYKCLRICKDMKVKKTDKKKNWSYAYIILMILGFYFASIESLYYVIDEETKIQPIEYYERHSIYSNGVVALGYYEYAARDIYFSIHEDNIDELIEDEMRIRKKYYREPEENKYTGIFKDKNLIMILMESMDEIVMTEETSPTILRLRREGLNFTNRYSYISRGGHTLASEFTSLTGLMYRSDYHFIMQNGTYSDALPKVFKDNGYQTNSMHENVGTYYNRKTLHPRYSFDHSYFLMDMTEDVIPYTDAQMVDNNEFYDKIIPKNGQKFMSYITTISAHGPYTLQNEECIGTNSEIECFKKLANRTDVFINHLLKRLEEDQLLDDTVIVLITDHQAYTYNFEEEYLQTLKTVDKKHLLKSLPFIIYSKDIEHQDIDLFVNDIDIVPTLLNMFGIEYNPNTYIGSDLFRKDRMNLLLFDNFTWYDGTYSVYSNASTNPKYNEELEYMNDIFRRNEALITYTYYDLK